MNHDSFFAISDPQSKRRSEEPLFKIIHKLVDETDEPVIEEGDNKENQCKENINDGNNKENEFKENNANNEEVVSIHYYAIVCHILANRIYFVVAKVVQ